MTSHYDTRDGCVGSYKFQP